MAFSSMNPLKTLLLLLLLFNVSCYALKDRITLNQSITGSEKLASKGGKFELGFFKPGKSSYYYLGIWFSLNLIPQQTVVWVANRETPLTDISKTTLAIYENGNIVLSNQTNPLIWSTNTTRSRNTHKVEAVLLDTGNLVLRNASNPNITLWQSFDHPTHTWLSGGKLGINKVTNELQRLTSWKNEDDPAPGIFNLEIDRNGTSQYFVLWNHSYSFWSSGTWTRDRIFSLVPEMTASYNPFNIDYISNEKENYFTYAARSDCPLTFRFIMDLSGQIKMLTWLNNSGWSLLWAQPKQQCGVHALCGPFGVCNEVGLPFCNCIRGFSINSPSDWALSDWSKGCVRDTKLECESNGEGEKDQFYMMLSARMPDDPKSVQVGSAVDCESNCLNHCSCSAYTYNSSGCFVWHGALINLQDWYDGPNGGTLLVRLAASEHSDNIAGSKNKTRSKIVIICTSAVGLFILTCILILLKFRYTILGCFKKKEKWGRAICSRKLFSSAPTDHSENEEKDNDLPWFNLNTMINATNNFSLSNKLGEGGFGGVFKGTLPGGVEVAVKKLSVNSGQGHEEFKNEMTLIAKLQHRNLVRLVGCCAHENEKMLIYEYMPNKSLDSFLFDPTKQPLLDWNKRFSIIEGIARGLVYLHRDSRFRIVHRDLKASNILLDVDMNPKISDFGMARIFGSDQNELNTRRVVGTFGYMSPEYVMGGFFSFKSDVYSFGILLLELVCGRRNNSFRRVPNTLNIVGYAWKLWDKQRAAEMIDPTILESCSIPQVFRCIQIGLLCVQDTANDRPDMHSVVLMLARDSSTLAIPNAPLFIMEKSPVQPPFVYDMNEICSVNNVTITELQAR